MEAEWATVAVRNEQRQNRVVRDFFLFYMGPTILLAQELTLPFGVRGCLSPRGFNSLLRMP